MGFNSNIQKAAADVLRERRMNAEKTAERNRADFFAKCPRAEELDREITNCGVRAAKAVLKGGDVVSEMNRLRDNNLTLQSEFKRLLISNGYEETSLEPHYTCSRCGDRGYFELDGRTVTCQCMKQALVKAACDELNRSAPLSLSTFESFSLDYYDKQIDPRYGVSPHALIERIYKLCKSYADNFTPNSKSLLMRGETGLGKTLLSLAIANTVIRRGYGVVYVSAPTIVQKLEKQYFSREESEEELVEMLTGCDLLIIDDLGTEFKTQFSTTQLYNIFNARLLNSKPVIINTNLSMRDLEKAYSPRFVSRIIGEATKLDFIGSDVRAIKNK